MAFLSGAGGDCYDDEIQASAFGFPCKSWERKKLGTAVASRLSDPAVIDVTGMETRQKAICSKARTARSQPGVESSR